MDFQGKNKKPLLISYEDYIDHLNDDLYLIELLKSSRKIIEDGGKVILERRYVNSTPGIVRVFSTINEIEEWQNEIKEIKEKRMKG